MGTTGNTGSEMGTAGNTGGLRWELLETWREMGTARNTERDGNYWKHRER